MTGTNTAGSGAEIYLHPNAKMKRLDEMTFDAEAINGSSEIHQKWDMDLGKPHGVVGDVGVREVLGAGDGIVVGGDPRNDLARYKDMVNHPPHYTSHPNGVECISVIEHMPYCRGAVIKYIWRAGQKNNELEDLEKAKWCIEREIARLKASTTASSDAPGYHGC